MVNGDLGDRNAILDPALASAGDHARDADDPARDHAIGALAGLALGDALGMPTQSMSPDGIARVYGGPVRGFVDADAGQPIAPGMRARSVTDDTEQALLLAGQIVRGRGRIDLHRYARELIDWEARMKARGSLDLLGPSTKRALEALQRGVDPSMTGMTGTTNGGAMRAAPLGVAFAPGLALERAAHDSCVVTHNTPQGHESTLLVALAVSLGVEWAPQETPGAMVADPAGQAGAGMAGDDRFPVGPAMPVGRRAGGGVARVHVVLREAVRRLDGIERSGAYDLGHWSPKASVRVRVGRALEHAIAWSRLSPVASSTSSTPSRQAGLAGPAPMAGTEDQKVRSAGGRDGADAFADWIRDEVGVSVEANESVAAAFAVAAWFADRPFDGLVFAANLGGDTDTIAAMSGAMLGGILGMGAWPADEATKVARANGIDFAGVADRLLRIRAAAGRDETYDGGDAKVGSDAVAYACVPRNAKEGDL